MSEDSTPAAGSETEYLVGFLADTLGVLGKGHELVLKLPGVRVLAVNNVPNTESVPQGLRILVTLRTKSIEDAVKLASKGVEHMSDALAFGLAAAVGECRPEFAVDFTEGAATREVYQRVPIPPVLRPMRTLNPLNFISVTGSLRRVASKHQPRLQRAIAWLRKSYDQQNPYDELVNLWMGLEAINPVVSERHALRDAEEPLECPHCHKQAGKSTTKAGVNHVLRELMGTPMDVVKRLNRLRNALLHSYEPVANLDEQLQELLPIARRALVYAIMDAAGVPGQYWDDFSKQPLARQNEAYFELFSEAEGMLREHILRDGAFPLLKLVGSDSEISYGVLGRVNTDTKVHLEFVRPPPYALKPLRYRTVTVRDPEDDTARIELKDLQLIPADETREQPGSGV